VLAAPTHETIEYFLIFFRYRIMHYKTEPYLISIGSQQLDFSYVRLALDDMEKKGYFFDDYLKGQVAQIRNLMENEDQKSQGQIKRPVPSRP